MKYPHYAYDDHGHLKFTSGFWLSTLFLLHPYVIVVLSFANPKDRMALINLLYLDRSMLALAAIMALPTILIMLAWIKRHSSQSRHIHRLWSTGRRYLLLSAIGHVVISSMPLWTRWYQINALIFLQWVFSITVVLYFLLSVRTRDVFRQ